MFNAADKMAVDAQNISNFIDQIDTVSHPMAEREYQMLLADGPSKQQPG